MAILAWLRRPASRSAIANTSIVLMTAVTGLFVARLLGPYDRGLLAVAFGWFGLLLALSEFTFNQTATYWLSRSPEHHLKTYARIRFMSLSWGCAAGAGLALFAYVMLEGQLRVCLVLLGAILPAAALVSVPTFALLSARTDLWNRIRFVQPVTYAVGIASVAGIVPQVSIIDVTIVFGVSTIVQLFAASLLWRRVRSGLKDDSPNDEPTGREMIHYGLVNLLSGLPHMVSERLPYLVLPFWFTPTQIGLLAVASSMTAAIPPATVAAGQVALPHLAKDSDGCSQARVVQDALRSARRISALLIVITFTLVPFLVPRVLGDEFSSAVPLALVLCLPAGMSALSGVNRLILRGLAVQRSAVVPQWAGLFALSLGLPILAGSYGLGGAAAAMLIGAWVTLTMYHRALKRVRSRLC